MRAIGAGEAALCCHLQARVRSASALRRRQVDCVRVTQMCDIIICFHFKSMCRFEHFQYDKKKRFVLAQMWTQHGHCQECFCLKGAKPERSGWVFWGKAGYDSLYALKTNHASSHMTNSPVMTFPHACLQRDIRGPAGMWSSRKVCPSFHIHCDLPQRAGTPSFPKSPHTQNLSFTAAAKAMN